MFSSELLNKENQINVDPNEDFSKRKKKKNIIILVTLIIIILALALGLGLGLRKKKNKEDEEDIEIKTLNLPDNLIVDNANYLPSGRIFLFYTKTDSPGKYLGIMDDTGSNFKEIIKLNIEERSDANGIRINPFIDNKRILLGDYIFECTDTLDSCSNPQIYEIKYPSMLYNSSIIFKRWSEPLIAPDCEHIVWTTLHLTKGSINFIGKLKLENNDTSTYYNIENVSIISSSLLDNYDNETKIYTPKSLRGGELKQFIRGGKSLTLSGTSGSGLVKSIVQDLDSTNVYTVTNAAGYEETVTFSPDEKLGMVMSTRFSPKTNLAIVGLLKIPNDVICAGNINGAAYEFSVTQVRKSRKGNIGPVLIDIEKTLNDSSYLGINLNRDENWVFKSPMTWHYTSKKTIWLEINRETQKTRIRIGYLNKYNPGEPVQPSTVPENISYAKDISYFYEELPYSYDGIILGNHGNITFNRGISSTELYYNNYSENGQTFYNGKITYTKTGYIYGGIYNCEIVATGEDYGNCNFQLTFDDNANLLFDNDESGKPKTRGTSTYKETTINAEIYK